MTRKEWEQWITDDRYWGDSWQSVRLYCTYLFNRLPGCPVHKNLDGQKNSSEDRSAFIERKTKGNTSHIQASLHFYIWHRHHHRTPLLFYRCWRPSHAAHHLIRRLPMSTGGNSCKKTAQGGREGIHPLLQAVACCASSSLRALLRTLSLCLPRVSGLL